VFFQNSNEWLNARLRNASCRSLIFQLTMNSHIRTFGSAPIAIAAMLALGSTPLAAQMAPAEPNPGPAATTVPPPATAEGAIVGPIEGNAPVSAPQIAAEPLPVEPVPIAEQPATNEIAASDTASVPAAARKPIAKPAQTEPVAAAPAPRSEAAPADAPVTSDEATPADEALAVGDLAPLDLDALPVAVPVEPETLAQPADQSDEVILAGLLAGLGLGAIGWAAIGLRRRSRRAAKARPMPVIEKTAPAEPLPASIPPAAAVPFAPPTPSDIREWMRPNPAERNNAAVSNEGAAVALPPNEPETFSERNELLRRMVEAHPDRANPFRGFRARARRARLIIQSLGHTFDKGRSWIDFSQYPNNWPELRRNYAAAA